MVSMAKHVVAPVESLPPGTQRRFVIAGRNIAVFNVDGRLYALKDVCPHQGAALSAGTTLSWVSATKPGCYDFEPGRKLVKCPWHGWEYELATGRSWYDPDHDRVRAYDVSVAPGKELVEDHDGRVPGPYTAETFPVSVEDEYIVIDV